MSREELLEGQVVRLLHAVRELRETVNWRDRLARLKEVVVYWKDIEANLDLVVNVIRQDCRRQTGLRTVEPFWRTYSRIQSDGCSTPPVEVDSSDEQ